VQRLAQRAAPHAKAGSREQHARPRHHRQRRSERHVLDTPQRNMTAHHPLKSGRSDGLLADALCFERDETHDQPGRRCPRANDHYAVIGQRRNPRRAPRETSVLFKRHLVGRQADRRNDFAAHKRRELILFRRPKHDTRVKRQGDGRSRRLFAYRFHRDCGGQEIDARIEQTDSRRAHDDSRGRHVGREIASKQLGFLLPSELEI
jgi:hypothetical protein